MNLKPIMTTEPNPPRHPSNDNPLIHQDEIAKQAKNLKPITAIESKSPRHPSNGPIYATPWNSKKKDDKDSKNTKIGVSKEKSGESTISTWCARCRNSKSARS